MWSSVTWTLCLWLTAPPSSLAACSSHPLDLSPHSFRACCRLIGFDLIGLSPRDFSCLVIWSYFVILLPPRLMPCSRAFRVLEVRLQQVLVPILGTKCIPFSIFFLATRSGSVLLETGCDMCSKLELLQAILIILQVDLNLFKMQREHADPISSADPSIVHTLNADVWMSFLHHLCSLSFLFFTR